MMNLVTTPELMTIGAFARATGLTPGALRFYADAALLVPARIDGSTGYRYYAPDQIDQATTVRRLRHMDMPLEQIALVLAGDATHIDRHVAHLDGIANRARRSAAEIRATLHPDSNHPNDYMDRKCIVISVSGPIFADAVDQILTATAHHPEYPVLGGVHVEARGDVLTVTATDRYRLSTRTVVVAHSDSTPWNAVIDGDDLRAAMPDVRREHVVAVNLDDSGIVFGPGGRHCRRLNEEFPDYRSMLDSLPVAVTRVVVSKRSLQRVMEDGRFERWAVATGHGRIRLSEPDSSEFADIPATVTGPDVVITFAMTTLYPAVASAVGPDVMIDISGPTAPVVVRSADDGDLTTLAMPVDPRGSE